MVRVKGADLASLLRSSEIDPSVSYVMINESQKVPDFVSQLTKGGAMFTYKPDEEVEVAKEHNLPALKLSGAFKSISHIIKGKPDLLLHILI